MFGGMFENHFDDGSNVNNAPLSTRACEDAVGKPRCSIHQGGTGLAGIANQGATCYLNSLIQTLLFTPELRGTLFVCHV